MEGTAMKKNYSAPKLLLERFELKQRITESCSTTGSVGSLGSPSSADKGSCGWKIGEGMILWPSAPACSIHKSVDEEVGNICYNNPNPSVALFIS